VFDDFIPDTLIVIGHSHLQLALHNSELDALPFSPI